MVFTDVGKTQTSDLTSEMDNYEVPTAHTDSATEQKETRWQEENWYIYFGDYINIPEMRTVIDTFSTWTMGRGVSTDEDTEVILRKIKGFGKDTFNTILENMIRTMYICGNSYAQIIKDTDGDLINIRPLGPENIVIVANNQGVITGYEQINRINKSNKKFAPKEIFHLARNRVSDEIHGRGIIEALRNTTLTINEAIDDWKTALHRNVYPIRIWKLDSDNQTKIGEFKAQVHNAFKNKGEHLFVPKDAAEHDIANIPPNSTLNPQGWIEQNLNKFYEAVGMPRIIVGGTGGVTEAAVKIAYLAWEQRVAEERLNIEEQCGMQLGIEITLGEPVSLRNELLTDESKDRGRPFQPNDTIAGREK